MSVCLKTVLFVFLILTKAQAFVVGQSCGQLFDQTGDVISYIADLSQNQKLSVEQMSRLYEALKSEDKFINPYTKQDAIASDAFIHWQKFEELVRDGVIDKKKLVEWLEVRLKEKKRVKTERAQVRDKTEDSHVKMTFHPIEVGRQFMMGEPGQQVPAILRKVPAILRKFMMGEPGKQVPTTLTIPFEMMEHKVTQKQWSLVMEENPSYFVDGPHTITLEVNGKKIKMQPNNPVEQVIWDKVQLFIKKLNKLSGRDDPLIYEVIPDHVKGAHYRLPSEDEWEYVARNQGQETGEYAIDPSQLKDHAWFSENSNGTTHPVGEKLPQIINGHKFEMFGNVWEWVQDSRSKPLSAGVDPLVELGPGSDHVVRGGGWGSNAEYLRSASRIIGGADGPSNGIGVRLVRILP